MLKKLRLSRKLAVATSLALAGATIATAASAIGPRPRDPVCDQQVADGCVVFWQTLGYPTYADCVRLEQCYQCPPSYGYLCGYDPRYYSDPATKHDQPW